MGGSVEVDWSQLDAALTRLSRGLTAGGQTVAQRQATATAGKIRAAVPRRSGRLASSVAVTPVPGGFGVTYGQGVPYAAYIEKRSHAVANGTAGAEVEYVNACRAMAATEAGRL
jgi:hypothetical protein